MVFVSYMYWISAKRVYEFGEEVAGAVWDAWWNDCGWSEEVCSVKTREYFRWGGEEGAEAECEEVGGVAGGTEDVARNLEVAVAYLDKY